MNARRLLQLLCIAALTFSAAGFAAAQAQPSPGAKPATFRATFAGGCFRCMEEVYDKVPGVIATVSGYMGGHARNPTRYKFYKSGCRREARLQQLWGEPGS